MQLKQLKEESVLWLEEWVNEVSYTFMMIALFL